jgi:hypothetical protein
MNMQTINSENLILAKVKTAMPAEALVGILHCHLAVLSVTTNNFLHKMTEQEQNIARVASRRLLYVHG